MNYTDKSASQEFIEAPLVIKQQAIAEGIERLKSEGLIRPLPEDAELVEVAKGLVWVVVTDNAEE